MKRIGLASALLMSLGTLVWAQSGETESDWGGFLILWGIIVVAALLVVLLKRLFGANH